MIHKAFDAIDQTDIQLLVDEGIPEGRTIEYKRELALAADSEKKEFLADISSFANANGGDLIYGVSERTDEQGRAVPDEALGLEGFLEDERIRSLESLLISGIAPRIGFQIRAIPGFEKGPVLLIRVRQSWNRPHMVTFKGTSRFYSRNSMGKYQLDVQEIRSAFALSESLGQQVRDFRNERLLAVAGENTPIPMEANPKVVLHLIAVDGFTESFRLNLTEVEEHRRHLLFPLYSQGGLVRHNFDGLLVFSTSNEARATTYCQLFRTGAVEAVGANIIRASNPEKFIPSTVIEREVRAMTARYLELLRVLDLGLPVIVMLALVGVRGYLIPGNGPAFPDEPPFPIERDVLLLPDVLLEDDDVDVDEELAPIFEIMWQASGWPTNMSKYWRK